MPDGCIYVARNNVINPPNLYKIGKTEFTSPERRMNELSNETTNWDGKFEALAWVQVEDVDKCEKIIHQELSNKRVRRNREFFFEDFNSIIEKIRIHLNNYIIPGRGKLENFNLHNTSIKITERFFKQKSSSILELFDYINKNSMCSNFECWDDGHAFQRSLVIILLNSVKNKITESQININNSYTFIKKLYEKKVFNELCKQLSELSDDHLYLFNNNITNSKEQHGFTLTKKSIKPDTIKNIFVILNKARNDKSLKKIINEKLKFTAIYESFILNTKLKLSSFRKNKIEKKIRLEEELKQQKINKLLKEEKKRENKIRIKRQKIEQDLKNKKRTEYLIKLKKLDLLSRLKEIIINQPYGINGIPEDFFETSNEINFKNTFTKLDIKEKKKFNKLIEFNNKNFFKKLKKLIDKY